MRRIDELSSRFSSTTEYRIPLIFNTEYVMVLKERQHLRFLSLQLISLVLINIQDVVGTQKTADKLSIVIFRADLPSGSLDPQKYGYGDDQKV